MGEFMKDLGLVFSNCKAYHEENSFLYQQAETLDSLVNYLVDVEDILMKIENVDKLAEVAEVKDEHTGVKEN